MNIAAAAAIALAITSPASAAPVVQGCVIPEDGSPLPAFVNPDLRPGAPRTMNGVNGGPWQLTLGFPLHGDTEQERTVALAQAPSIYGSIMTPAGQPIAAARVWLAVADCTGQWRLDSTPLISAETGAITARLAPFRQPRTLALVYFPYTDLNEYGTSPPIRLTVRASAALHANRRHVPAGGRVRLSARADLPVTPGTSILAMLQLFTDGNWRPFRQLRFAPGTPVQQVTVRFRRSAPGTVYRFRLRIPAQTGLPYASGTSRSVKVTIR